MNGHNIVAIILALTVCFVIIATMASAMVNDRPLSPDGFELFSEVLSGIVALLGVFIGRMGKD